MPLLLLGQLPVVSAAWKGMTAGRGRITFLTVSNTTATAAQLAVKDADDTAGDGPQLWLGIVPPSSTLHLQFPGGLPVSQGLWWQATQTLLVATDML